jgi:hypothetical protein
MDAEIFKHCSDFLRLREPKQATRRNHKQQFSKTLRGEMNGAWQSA